MNEHHQPFEELKRAKPAIKLHLTISLKPPKWLY